MIFKSCKNSNLSGAVLDFKIKISLIYLFTVKFIAVAL